MPEIGVRRAGPSSTPLSVSPNGASFSEWLIVLAVTGVFVAMQIAFPRFLDSVAEGQDQNLAPLVLLEVKESSFWRLFWDGQLPARRGGYHGTLMAYLYMPFYALLGPDWRLIKFWHLLFAVPGVVMTYLFTKELFDRTTALWGLVLLVIHPHFEAGMRMGRIMHGYLLFFAAAPLFCFAKWWNTKNSGWYYAGLFLLGLGMTTQFWYFWLIAGLTVVGFIYRSQLFRQPPFNHGYRWIVHSALSFFSGAALFVYHELWHPFQSVTALWNRWESTTTSSHYPSRLFEMFRYINVNFSSLEFDMFLYYDYFTSLVSGNRFFPWALWGCVAWLLWRGTRRREPRLLIFPAIFLTMVLLAPLQGAMSKHMFFFYPFPALILAVAAVESFRAANGRKMLKGSLLAASVIFLAIEARGAWTLMRFVQNHQTNHHKNLYDLAAWLLKSGSQNKIVLGYGWQDMWSWSRDLTLYSQVPGKKFRFVYYFKDPAPAGRARSPETQIHFFSESENPSGEVSVLAVPHLGRGILDVGEWPAPAQKWFRERGEPEARFGDPEHGTMWEVYDGRFDESVWPRGIQPASPQEHLLY